MKRRKQKKAKRDRREVLAEAGQELFNCIAFAAMICLPLAVYLWVIPELL